MMYIPDPFEAGEAMVENWAFDNVKDGKFKCDCGKWIKLEDGVPVSPNPYGIPVCPECADRYFEDMENMKK